MAKRAKKKQPNKAAMKTAAKKVATRGAGVVGGALLVKDIAKAAIKESKKSRAASKGKGPSGQMKRKKRKSK